MINLKVRMTENTADTQSTRILPEVPLKWSDFKWSLEKLIHKDYGPKMNERDWFRINPLEVFLLGCRSLCTGEPARRDHGTLMLTMEDVTPYMASQLRYWIRMLEILQNTLHNKSVSALIRQRCCTILHDLWEMLNSCQYIGWMCHNWCMVHLKPSLDGLSNEVISNDIRHKCESLTALLSAKHLVVQQYIKDSISARISLPESADMELSVLEIAILKPFLEGMTEVNYPVDLVTKLSLAHETLKVSILNDVVKLSEDTETNPVTSLLSVVMDTSSDVLAAVSKTVDLIMAGVVSLGSKVPASVTAAEETDSSSSHPPFGNTSSVSNLEKLQVHQFTNLLENLCLAIKKWYTMVDCDKSSTTYYLLELVTVTLQSRDIKEAVEECSLFSQQPLECLMQYACEGYLSDRPCELLCALLQFASSVVESGSSLNSVLLHYLPNLFGPIFGVRRHEVTLKVLEYGELALHSRFQELLLTQGLQDVAKVYSLFQPAILKYATERSIAEKCEAVAAAITVIKEVLQRVSSSVGDVDNGEAQSESLLSVDPPSLSDPETTASVVAADGDFPSEPTSEDVEQDKAMRHDILLKLLQLACSMIKNGDDIKFIFKSELPKLFYQSYSLSHLYRQSDIQRFVAAPPSPPGNALALNVDKRKFAESVLQVAIKATDKDVSSPFKILAILVPKMNKNFKGMGFPDEERAMLLTEVFKMTSDVLDSGGDVEGLISHGLDLVSLVLVEGFDMEELREFLQQMFKQLSKSSQSSILFYLHHSANAMLSFVPDREKISVRELFRKLMQKGKRNEIRVMYHIASEEFCQPKYHFARNCLYQFGEGNMSARNFILLTDVLISVLRLEPGPKKRIDHETELEEDPEEREKRIKADLERNEVTSKLLSGCLKELQKGVQEQFSKEICFSVSKQASLIMLFRTLFWEEMPSLHDLSQEEIQQQFNSKIPVSILENDNLMERLTTAATRLEHLQLPRYKSLKTYLSGILQELIRTEQQMNKCAKTGLEGISEELECHIRELPWNRSYYGRLLSCGYKEAIWRKGVTCTITTNGSFSLQENLRQSLLACFQQYSELLLNMAVTHVHIDEDMVESNKLFSEELTLSELKGRRALAVKTIDQRLGANKEGEFQERKIALLVKEDEIESNLESQAKQPLKPQVFKCVFNTTFVQCMSCCGPQIIGCYAPNGEHCERPLEIGARCDSGFISIYDSTGTEIENTEVLFCEEGLYVFRSYTNGHPFDTSQVWASMFSVLLKEPMVPAIIIPEGHPNECTWKLLRQSLPAEVTGSILTCQHDISAEWRSYFDLRPERIRCGQDIVLNPQFAISSGGGAIPQLLQRQRSRLNKDLAGMMFDFVMQDLLTDPEMQDFRFLGKTISLYISKLVQTGVKSVEIIMSNFDHMKWKKTAGSRSSFSDNTKEDIVLQIQQFIDVHVENWLETCVPEEFLQNSPKQSIELKNFLAKTSNRSILQSSKLNGLTALIQDQLVYYRIQDLPFSFQEELMHWIFNNEDRVWRYRGGRDNCETLAHYMRFIGKDSSGPGPQKKIYPGMVVFFLLNPERQPKIGDVVAYAVGEVIEGHSQPSADSISVTPFYKPKSKCYEVVTAWVHPNFRQLRLGVNMYMDITKRVPANLIMCDMLLGSVEKIIQSNVVLRLLKRLHLVPLIVIHRDKSYQVQTEMGHLEQFERIVYRAWPIRCALWIHSWIAMLLKGQKQ